MPALKALFMIFMAGCAGNVKATADSGGDVYISGFVDSEEQRKALFAKFQVLFGAETTQLMSGVTVRSDTGAQTDSPSR